MGGGQSDSDPARGVRTHTVREEGVGKKEKEREGRGGCENER